MKTYKNNTANKLQKLGFDIFKADSNDQTNCKGYTIYFERKNCLDGGFDFGNEYSVSGDVDIDEADTVQKTLVFVRRSMLSAHVIDSDDYLIIRTNGRGHCSTEEISTSEYIDAMDAGYAIAITMENGDTYAEWSLIKDNDFSSLVGIKEIHTKKSVLKF